MSEKRFCLQCDDGTLLEHDTKDLIITLEGLSVTVPALSGWHCPSCGDCEFDDGEGKRYSEALEALRKTVDKRRATELRGIRKKLGLKQTEAGRLFGGGASAFSEYEHGKTQPHKSTVLLLRLLDKHPELLKELVT
ncbi:HTH-type transcriptional regulator / antitoxin MqsA [Gammaproteobacteria bacterium]